MRGFHLIVASLLISAGCANRGPEVVFVNTAKIEATLSERMRWVSEQKQRDRSRFEIDYGWILASASIGSREAIQLAHLFFYSSRTYCGAFAEPQISNGVWRLDFQPGFPPSSGLPVFVDAKSGEVWQSGMRDKLDALALIRHE